MPPPKEVGKELLKLFTNTIIHLNRFIVKYIYISKNASTKPRNKRGRWVYGFRTFLINSEANLHN